MENEMKVKAIHEKIENFKDKKVWFTKKSRIESEARMKRNDTFSQFAISYYTFFVLAISIYGTVNRNDNIGVISTIVSIGLFGLSIFIGVIDYKGKAYRYKESYTQLDNLENRLEHLLECEEVHSQLSNRLNELREEYNAILKLTENHDEIDFINVKSDNNNQRKWTKRFYKFKVFLLKTIILLAPIIAIYKFI